MSNMAVQMNYGEPSRGMPGLLYDRANYDAVTRRNSAEDGKLFFGCGVVQGAEPGKDITLPATARPARCGYSWPIRRNLLTVSRFIL